MKDVQENTGYYFRDFPLLDKNISGALDDSNGKERAADVSSVLQIVRDKQVTHKHTDLLFNEN